MKAQSLSSVTSLVITLLTLEGATSFQVASNNQQAAKTTSLDAISRRDVIASSSAVLAGVPFFSLLTEEAQAAETAKMPALKPDRKTAAKYYFNGVFKDKNHPDGYRVVAGGLNKPGIVTLRDTIDGKETEIPMQAKRDEETGKLTIDMDLSAYRDDLTTNVVATVRKDGCLAFPDGNVWIKEKGVAGVYVDGFAPYPKYRRVVVPTRDNQVLVSMVSGKKVFDVPGIDLGKKGLQVEFPGKQCTGAVNGGKGYDKKGTITWQDGNIWTKI